jgi:hypothetical protein
MAGSSSHVVSGGKSSAGPLTDSAWFWAALFSAMALVALVAMSGKYGRRQANIEQKFQARERQKADGEERANGDKEYSTPGNTVISLWPLAVPLMVLIAVSIGMLIRSREAVRRLSTDDADGHRLNE